MHNGNCKLYLIPTHRNHNTTISQPSSTVTTYHHHPHLTTIPSFATTTPTTHSATTIMTHYQPPPPPKQTTAEPPNTADPTRQPTLCINRLVVTFIIHVVLFSMQGACPLCSWSTDHQHERSINCMRRFPFVACHCLEVPINRGGPPVPI